MSERTNCLITIARYGRVRVKATRVVHGMSVVQYSSGGKSRRGQAFYPSKRTSGSFELTLQFASHAGYERVARWLERYSRWASNAKSKATPVRVIIPSRDFDKVGMLEAGITYGDQVGATTYEMTLAFVGSRDPLELVKKNYSAFRLPKRRDDPTLPYLYPGGTQLEAGETGWDTVWDRGLNENLPGGGEDDPIDEYDTDPLDPVGPAQPAGP